VGLKGCYAAFGSKYVEDNFPGARAAYPDDTDACLPDRGGKGGNGISVEGVTEHHQWMIVLMPYWKGGRMAEKRGYYPNGFIKFC
jgi:hypothetical protein